MIPRPLANNVGFWLPPLNAACTLFKDGDCMQNTFTSALGAMPNVKQTSCCASPTLHKSPFCLGMRMGFHSSRLVSPGVVSL
ncbi:hypothetical protein EXIGLDRAFT_717739 [Exidia glandulosa HHB12029]|uniref:Uncharacterized protein n=1 Tax=Exidia glandulosa HHB12029 TaxID=1314781 RepID=A0A165I6A0_EXIGL|nr:hypothetical protein EXIGLDRAFT_717726 [Exidia glandulosa HHB12029]KZV92985.1 hypothetical protein EXIGLDRAFT_717739 [Exidia glandulosa HHB12029]